MNPQPDRLASGSSDFNDARFLPPTRGLTSNSNFQHLWTAPADSVPPEQTDSNANPGWYVDNTTGVLRWWNGTAWSSHTAPLGQIVIRAPEFVNPQQKEG